MANRYDTNLILDRIADALEDDQNSALIASLEDIKTAIENGGGGGGGGGGAAYNITTLWDYTSDNSGSILYGLNTATLHDSIDNYNYLILEVVSTSSDETDVTWKGSCQFVINVAALQNAFNSDYIICESVANRSCKYHITGTTLQKTAEAAANTNGLVRVYGIKITGSGGGGDPHNEMIATEFSPSSTYAFGEYCIHNDTYYKCINAINTPGAWDITDWQATNVGNELSTLNSNKQSKLSVEATDWISVNTTSIIAYNVAKTGKTAIGIVGYSRDGQTVLPYILNINQSTQNISMAFPSSGGSIRVYVLYESKT